MSLFLALSILNGRAAPPPRRGRGRPPTPTPLRLYEGLGTVSPSPRGRPAIWKSQEILNLVDAKVAEAAADGRVLPDAEALAELLAWAMRKREPGLSAEVERRERKHHYKLDAGLSGNNTKPLRRALLDVGKGPHLRNLEQVLSKARKKAIPARDE